MPPKGEDIPGVRLTLELYLRPGMAEPSHIADRPDCFDIDAANLSAAKAAVCELVKRLWDDNGWPRNVQPYGTVERDARYFFDWWVRGKNYDELGAEDTARKAIARARRLLGFTGQRPARRKRAARTAPTKW